MMVSTSRKTQIDIISGKRDKILCILILFCVILGNTFSFGNIRVAGLILTPYRVGIPLIAVYFISKRFREGRLLQYFSNKLYLIYMFIITFWIGYGSVFLFISKYASLYDGLKEILDLVFGMLTVYNITECCRDKEIFKYFLNIIKIIICVLCVMALFELLCDIHFPTSKYANLSSVSEVIDMAVLALTSGYIFPVTSIFYGVNDFATFIAIFFPLFFIYRGATQKDKVINFIFMIIITFILTIDDANVCLVSIMLSVIFMMLLKVVNKFSIGYLIGIFAMQQWVSKWIHSGIIKFETWFAGINAIREKIEKIGTQELLVSAEGIEDVSSISEVLTAQLQTAEQGYGSLYSRVLLLLDALDMWLDSHLLGIGPAGFTNYLLENGARTKYVNPHNWWFEILSQYGIFVFVAYVGILFYMFVKNIKNYFANKDFAILQYICILVSYVVASVTPSTFLGYNYQWIVPALGMVCLRVFKQEEV